ncbi:MAG: phytoene/squalene synthase family protein [Hyphomicrobiales bacterium]
MDLAAAQAHALELVRDHDKDRYLAALFVPDEMRGRVAALCAFNVELARIRDHMREPMLGEIRLQFWADQVEAILAGETPEHPVAQALADAIRGAALPERAFRGMIEARRFDLYDDPMPTLNDLEGYLGETSSALIQLSALAVAGPAAETAAHAAGSAGVAIGIAGLLRSLPLYRSRGQSYLPGDVLARHGVTVAHVLSGRESPEMAAVLADLRAHARKRLAEARAEIGRIPEAALPAFLPAALVDGYLNALDRAGLAALRAPVEVPQWQRQARLLWSAWRDRF